MFVDSHAHLFFKDFENDLDDVIKRAQDAGVEYIINPGTDIPTSKKSIELAEKYDMIYAGVGFHPHDASKADNKSLEEIERLSHHPKVVAIGEIGLDYHYDFAPREKQREVFSQQIDIAVKRNLPIIIHSREAEEDTLQIVEEKVKANPEWRKNLVQPHSRYPSPKGVFHCFPGDSKMAWKVINWGFYISLPGFVTFPNKPTRPNSMVEVAQNVSAEHILLETDSPYLSPAPFRGKRNEPSNIPFIAQKIAELQGLSVEDIGRASNFGVLNLFGVGKYPEPTIAYKLKNSLYLNITIRCNADCVFCDRKGEAVIKGHNLKIEKEPTSKEVIQAIGDPTKYNEIVFCGFGEPTIRFDVVKEVSSWVKKNGGKVRLNTDGHGSVINHRNIVPELVGLVDSVSISLNSIDPKQYGELMRLDGQKYFPAMIDFAKECVKHKLDTTMTIVELDEVDEQKAREFVEKEIGAKFRNRPFF
ncbi:MAG: YchF/TatD family DNA exonuclease [Ignavibacteriae bacterium]|nr:YchF/TatD family DNA exonuclease [Ignavibacteriota bacterium]